MTIEREFIERRAQQRRQNIANGDLKMAFALAKRAHDGESAIYVTSIKRCWSSIDNCRIWDNRIHLEGWQVRKWASRALAEKALALIADIGGYDDFQVVEIEEI